MKRTIQFVIMVCVLTSVSFGAFDRIISDVYQLGGVTLHNESLLVTGSGSYLIDAREASYVEVQETAPLQEFTGGIHTLDLNDSSMANIYGGEVANFTIWDQARLVVQGGSIDYLHSYQYVLSPNQNHIPHIEIICREYDDSNPNFITGIWDVDNDGDGEFDTFAINLVDQPGYDSAIENIKFTTIPEPATLLLLGLGGFLIRKKR